MHRTFYFGKEEIEFIRWCKCISECRGIIRLFNITTSVSRNFRQYEEAKIVMNQYKVLSASLNKEERKTLSKLIGNEYDYHVEDKWVYQPTFLKWQEVIFTNGKNRLKDISAKELGTIMKKARIEAGYTIEAVSRICNVSNRAIQRFEAGHYYIKSETLIKLMKIYNIDLGKI